MKAPVIKLERIEGEYPVPSHGGASVGVEWVLSINGVVIGKDYQRYPWRYTPAGNASYGTEAPSHLKSLYDQLVQSFE